MRVSAESVNEGSQNAERRVDEQRTSDRFSQMLKSKYDKDQAQPSGTGGDDADARRKAPSPVSDSTSANPSGAASLDVSSSPSSLALALGTIVQAGTSAPSQIDNLIMEVGHQIDIFEQQGGTQAVNITFDSKTLEGLQVQIRQMDGELAIRFVTQSDHVSQLLSRHSGELREALSGKGVRIGEIAITNTRYSPVIRRNGNAGA